ncbi:hypothetical protein RSOLAG22IIIB_11507 [Rhizoctonia solani]|uniref:Nephrocystin 3-like N-terminal domain-containing protein n=1 Tax=Rhizoctonia solani TaxID=456999 RepID=A0A0K6G8K3_9AGAM|nr:hypothetical protein RSOLAG22IIIB_11507 [Rhizoctonia solani]
MDSSKDSKPRKGFRKLMDKLSVSRSRSRSHSPSQSFHQPNTKTLAPLARLSEHTRATGNVDPSIGSSSVGLQVPIVVGPIGEDTTSSQQNTEHSRKAGTPFYPSKEDKSAKSVAWNTLRTSLRFLYESSGVFPALSSAVRVLLSCIDGIEAVARHRDDYEELAATLHTMSESLKHYTNSNLLSESTTHLALSLEREAMEIRYTLGKMGEGGFRDANTGEEELLGHYRRIQSLFQQLQVNASLSTWDIVNEQSVNTWLEGLSPVKQATFDSSLSIEVGRRGCTEGTRTSVLAGLDSWLQNPSSASIYWMNGMAGTGKTTIAYSFCEHVEKRKQLAASFFCTRNAVDCRNISRIIPTIAYQLARYSIPYESALSKVLGQNPHIGTKHALKQFEQLLMGSLQQVKAAIPDDLVVVIDALDECDDRNGIERTLDMLFRCAEEVPLKFITSRTEPEIYDKMRLGEQSWSIFHLHVIEASLVQADIELYLTQELSSMLPHRSEIEQLAHRSGCLFIYAATLVRYIVYGKCVTNSLQRLQSVLSLASDSTKKHAEIDALYTAILESALHEAQMEEHETEDVNTVL